MGENKKAQGPPGNFSIPAEMSVHIFPKSKGKLVVPAGLTVELGGLTIGGALGKSQEKRVTPTRYGLVVEPDDDYTALSKVTVDPIPSDWGHVEYDEPKRTMGIT